MATTYRWVISQLECYPEHAGYTDVVFIVHWRRQAQDGNYLGDVYGSQALTPSPGPFIPYDELTQAVVEGWLEAAMGAERVAELDALLDKQIADQQNPPVVRPPLPWASGAGLPSDAPQV